ncbi:Rho termination factor-like protein [Arthrobacter sp. SLBN-112]|jgi:transcription termination factor Rho|uniref:Rho termination factor N-terminal domain-containing protein n=1 Tax=Arthrobacter sp. SLBN-112 TaxID=2768452 RepID=UPI001150E2DF|nr:Rho termination factor N-terminal domain-containing protein [Arthrobacter sp. SLBN-112]TQJ39681.1 Rho termination factor-like protein [Arthrobacter sp. SLBN-112]
MSEKPGNQTPNTPNVSETELRNMKVDELRKEAKEENVPGTSGMRKEELVKEVAKARQEGGDRSKGDPGAGPDGGKVRYGDDSSKSLKYSQEITSTDEEPEREGRSLATTHHEVIRQWAEERGGVPATVDGTEHGDHLGVLRIDFRDKDANLREVSWEEWFKTFDERRLNFIYQEQRTDGNQSNFFRLENPDREDA